jgi:hypothetical protein
MSRRGFCKHCNSSFERLKNPAQTYCSKKHCQLARKQAWRRKKMSQDTDYKANQQAANKRWQSKNLTYWQQYRAKHPEYVEQNCMAQRKRDSVKRGKASYLAKSDALSSKPLILSGTYWLTPVIGETLAKSDSLRVKILVEPGENAFEGLLAKSPLYSQLKT